jgi:hypothetical protein
LQPEKIKRIHKFFALFRKSGGFIAKNQISEAKRSEAKRSELVYFKTIQYRSEVNRFDSDFLHYLLQHMKN